MTTEITTAARRIARTMKNETPAGMWVTFDAQGLEVERGPLNSWPSSGFAPHAWRMDTAAFDGPETWTAAKAQEAMDSQDQWRAIEDAGVPGRCAL